MERTGDPRPATGLRRWLFRLPIGDYRAVGRELPFLRLLPVDGAAG